MSKEIAIQGWFDFQCIYDEFVKDTRPGGTIIELGVWKGASLCYLGVKAEDSGKGLRIIGIDNWKHTDWGGYNTIMERDREKGELRTPLEQCRDAIKALDLERTVELIESDSIAAAALFEDGSIDHIFIDDTHNSEHIEKELKAWIPKLRRPTWIAGHDFPGGIAEGISKIFHHFEVVGKTWIADVP